MVLLSIIIPTFNSAQTLDAALKSILSQTLSSFEVLIVDGLSTDQTLAIARKFDDERIKIHSERDNGVYDAMNKGIKRATGQWLYFLGSDDCLSSDTILQSIFDVCNREKCNVIYGNVQIVGDTSWAKDGDIYNGEYDLNKVINSNICHQGIFYKKSFIDTIGFYNIEYKLCADWDYNLRCWAKTKFFYINEVVCQFNAGGESTKNNNDVNFYNDFAKNLITYFRISPFNSLISDTSLWFYPKVLDLQIKARYFKYLTFKLRNKLINIKKRYLIGGNS